MSIAAIGGDASASYQVARHRSAGAASFSAALSKAAAPTSGPDLAVISDAARAASATKAAFVPQSGQTAQITFYSNATRSDQTITVDDDFFRYDNKLRLTGSIEADAVTVAALQDHLADRFSRFLAANDIPEAPSKISFSSYDGAMQFPSDYPYADKLKNALANDQGMSCEFNDVRALSSQLADNAICSPMAAGLQNATSESEKNTVSLRYSYLDNIKTPNLDFLFAKDGSMNVAANGSSYQNYLNDASSGRLR